MALAEGVLFKNHGRWVTRGTSEMVVDVEDENGLVCSCKYVKGNFLLNYWMGFGPTATRLNGIK
jgi:hypothetical protein